MGCWNETCYLSNLPIFCGDSVVVIPLMKIREETASFHPCEVADVFMPIGFPILGIYNDYGGIEKAETFDSNKEHLFGMRYYTQDGNGLYREIVKQTSFDAFLNETFCNARTVYVDVKAMHCFKDGKAPITFMMMHSGIYTRVIEEIAGRTPYGHDSNYRSVLLERYTREFDTITIGNMLSICQRSSMAEDDLTKYQQINRLDKIRKLSDKVFGYAFRFHRTVWDDCSEMLLDKPDVVNDFLSGVVDMTLFATALSYMRKGFLVNTGRGSQDCETRLHVILADFIREHVANMAHEDGNTSFGGVQDTVFFYG